MIQCYVVVTVLILKSPCLMRTVSTTTIRYSTFFFLHHTCITLDKINWDIVEAIMRHGLETSMRIDPKDYPLFIAENESKSINDKAKVSTNRSLYNYYYNIKMNLSLLFYYVCSWPSYVLRHFNPQPCIYVVVVLWPLFLPVALLV